MLVHKGGKIKNWGGECRDVTPTKSLSQNIRVDVNSEVFVKTILFFFGGGGGGGGVRSGGGGGGEGVGGHRVDVNKVFVKIKKKKKNWLGGLGGGGGCVRVDVNEELKFL